MLWKRWNVYRVDAPMPAPKITHLGRVSARHQPEAMLQAFKKFKTKTQAEQLKITVRPIMADPLAKGKQ